jgi:hypothetical protein
MEHPVLIRIRRESFEPLGWFAPEDMAGVSFVILIGNAGAAMFQRFARERNPDRDSMDEWTKSTVDGFAGELGARAVYPFDVPHQPFLTWARHGGAGHTSPLGLNIHPQFGLWHAYRAALLFPVAFDIPPADPGPDPCKACRDKPCLAACPVSAFDGNSYDVKACSRHLQTLEGKECLQHGCKARLACPIGKDFRYGEPQTRFHMRAFLKARQRELS